MSEEEKLKLLYDKYNKQRDEELSKFWKNSMYVWTFLMLCFTGFAVLINNYLSVSSDKLFKVQLSIAIVCSFGFMLSFVWTRMAQGLKAWYEVFEMAIWDIVCYNNVFHLPPNLTVNNYWSIDEDKVTKNNSPSALVVSIGWCLMIFWVLAFIINVGLYYLPLLERCCDNSSCCCQIRTEHSCLYVVLNIALFVIVLWACWFISSNTTSSVLRTGHYKATFDEIRIKLQEQQIPYKYLEVKKRNGLDTIRLVFDINDKDKPIIVNFISEITSQYSSYTIDSEYITNIVTNN